MAHTRTSPTRFPLGLINLSPESPFCPVDWRWRRAEWRARTKSRQNERYDDPWTRLAARHHRKLQRTHKNISGRQRLDANIVRAFEISTRNDFLHAELDARILANQPIPEISNAVAIPESVIAAYEALFFDVRRRLQASGWIRHNVLGSQCWTSLQPHDVTWLWKDLGFRYGSLAVDYLVNGVDHDSLVKHGISAYWAPESRVPKELQFLLVIRSLPDFSVQTLKSLTQLQEAGLHEMPKFYSPPPENLSLDLTRTSVCDEILSVELFIRQPSPVSSNEIPITRAVPVEPRVAQRAPVEQWLSGQFAWV